MPVTPQSCTVLGLGCVLLLSFATMTAADDPDPALIARRAIANLEQGPSYSWEFRDLDGEIGHKTIWKESPVREEPNPRADLEKQLPRATKVGVRTLSPIIRGEFRADGWTVTDVGFTRGPRVMAVAHPSGARLIQFEERWLTLAEFRKEHERRAGTRYGLQGKKEQMLHTSAWASLTVPLPHTLLPNLLRDATHFRFEDEEIVAELSPASARLLLGEDGRSRKLAPERFKGNARLRVREGVLRDCRIQMEYDVDLTQTPKPSAEGIDVLFLFGEASDAPPAVPETARVRLAGG